MKRFIVSVQLFHPSFSEMSREGGGYFWMFLSLWTTRLLMGVNSFSESLMFTGLHASSISTFHKHWGSSEFAGDTKLIKAWDSQSSYESQDVLPPGTKLTGQIKRPCSSA